ncbi:MAG: DUF1080 domain-containing protein [Kiritimatiellia bacterium]
MKQGVVMGSVLLAAGSALAGVYGDLPDAKHAWAVHDWNRPKPAKVEPAAYVKTGAPSDAIVLFDGTKESFAQNWCDKDGNPSQWKLGTEGDFYCVPGWKNGGEIRTRAEFGDCQLHIEYRHEADVSDGGSGPQMRGNSGVFLMGSRTGYEIQVLESYYTSRDLEGKPGFIDNYADGQAGSVYAENPPMVNPQRKPGEWQTYDIVFHQPVWEGAKLVHPGSVTVFFNGVLVQDHWEMEGLTTHCRRRPLAPHAKQGPLALQDHGCTVHFRNIWYRPLPSRWDNLTHSVLTANEDAVMARRRETAAALYAKLPQPLAPTAENMLALAEVISYAKEGKYAADWQKLAKEYHAVLDRMSDDELNAQKAVLLKLRRVLDTLIRGGVVPQSCGTRIRINAASLRLKWENL